MAFVLAGFSLLEETGENQGLFVCLLTFFLQADELGLRQIQSVQNPFLTNPQIPGSLMALNWAL